MAVKTANLDIEHELLTGSRWVVGMDEVGRGAIAGPVMVGAVVVNSETRPPPVGLTDSKLLSVGRRSAMQPLVVEWAAASAVGAASAAEIDALGIVGALRQAGRRALAEVFHVVGTSPFVLLDGSHDWLSAPEPDLFAEPEAIDEFAGLRVMTRVKADITCASVAGASVLAKCLRDELMGELAAEFPGYGWDRNKGYGTGDHVAGIAELGVSDQHRRSWKLPGVSVFEDARRAGDGS